jgi:hypothetical protein
MHGDATPSGSVTEVSSLSSGLGFGYGYEAIPAWAAYRAAYTCLHRVIYLGNVVIVLRIEVIIGRKL